MIRCLSSCKGFRLLRNQDVALRDVQVSPRVSYFFDAEASFSFGTAE